MARAELGSTGRDHMSTECDLVVRNGTIVDGSGRAPFVGDLAITGDRIVSVGATALRGRQEIDAGGRLITPGFVDIHTHYDGQITWENRLAPSSNHGVTTVVMGNCGVGFAPARPDRESHDLTIKLMEGVEDIPEVVMAEGVPWNWESFPDYLDALSQRQADVDFAAMLPHSPLRVYVMGQRGADLEPPTAADLAEMRRLTQEAIAAGAVGVSTSRNLAHRFRDGRSAPSVNTEEAELMALADGLRDAGRGLFQLIPSTEQGAAEEFALIRRLAERSGRPVTFSLLMVAKSAGSGVDRADWMDFVTGLEDVAAAGLAITGQIHPKPIGVLFGLTASYHPFSLNPSYRAIAGLPLAEKVAAMSDPAFRQQLLAETAEDPNPLFSYLVRQTEHLYPVSTPCDYLPENPRSIRDRALALGIDVRELIYDELLRDGGKAIIRMAGSDGAPKEYDLSSSLFGRPGVILGLGDGGAHYGMICDASYPTFMLTHFGRDAPEAKRLPVEQIVRMLARDTAEAFGFLDRGLLAPGCLADVNVIDLERLMLYAPKIVQDLPGQGGRLTQRADGYDYTIKSGQITYRAGRPTDALPGRLVRG